ncbi:hypothetical protein DFJ43DRAFT_1193874 [Lentinula guzmanii]|uniref:Clathrin adaptor alpha-adaptin appendage C-terminal subdomain domain-containing protein n=1 Tax=Lentinula guzmanii TaxID=2804957 RepID=A0AA38N5E2_9AGAR|nr:hypothetical protein DFJ43DRAFT_1193874 [Lentinula guzmanii]
MKKLLNILQHMHTTECLHHGWKSSVSVYYNIILRQVEPNLSCLKTLIQTNGSAASHTATGAAPTLDVLGSLTGLDWGRTDGPSSSEQPNQAVGPNIDRWSNSDGEMSRGALRYFRKNPSKRNPPRTQELLHVEFKKAFSTPPILTVSFLAGSHQTTSIRLPIVLTKYLDHVKLGQADFFERWKLIGGAPRESQSIFPLH